MWVKPIYHGEYWAEPQEWSSGRESKSKCEWYTSGETAMILLPGNKAVQQFDKMYLDAC